MLHKRLVTALVKAGATIEEHKRPMRDGSVSVNYVARKGDRCIDWYMYADQVLVDHTTMRSPYTDAQRDCFCDSYYTTIRGSVQALG